MLDARAWEIYMRENRSKWQRIDSKTVNYEVGQATYSAKYGTEMYVQITDITKGEQAGKILATFPVKGVRLVPQN